MKKRIALFMVLTVLLCTVMPCVKAFTVQGDDRSGAGGIDYSLVKARLTSLGNSLTETEIKLKGDYYIKETTENYSDCTLSVRLEDGVIKLYRDGTLRALASEINICRKNQIKEAGFAQIGKRLYLGDFRFRPCEDSNGNMYLQVINHVPMMYYLYGVLEGELGEGQPLEALKAQAVAAKCYAISSMKEGSNYDIGDTSTTQMYVGYDPAWTNIMRAVDESLTKVVLQNGKVLKTFYAASNGGETELPSDIWGGSTSTNAGYARTIDNYDFNSNAPRETLSIEFGSPVTNSKLYDLLLTQAQSSTSGKVLSVSKINYCELNSPKYSTSIRNMTNAYFDLTVKIETSSGQVESNICINFPVGQFYTAGVFTKSTLNTYWGTSVSTGKYEIYHVRFGHGAGLSQNAAIYRANMGQTYDEILSFYYPGMTLSDMDISRPSDVNCDTPSTEIAADISVANSELNDTIKSFNTTSSNKPDIISTQAPDNPIIVLNDDEYMGEQTQVLSYAYVKNAGAELKSSPTGVVINRLAYGDMLTVLKNDAGWCHVETHSGMTGFIMNCDVQILDKAGTNFTYKLGYVNSDSVNFRERPSTTASTYGKLSKNSVVYIWGTEGNNNEWYYVQSGLTYGYVYAQYIDVKGTYTAGSVTSGSVVASGITKASVNLRPEPNTNNTPITTLSGGTYILIYAYENHWYRVQANGIQGYLRDDYVTVNTAIPISPSGVTQPIEPQPIGMGIIKASDVRFRSTPDTSSNDNIIELLQKGDRVTLYSLENNWYYAKHDGKTGYVAAQYVEAETYSGPQQPEASLTLARGRATANVNFRSAPNTGSEVYIKLTVNTAFEVIGQTDDWYYIRYNGRTGYVSKLYSEITSQGNVGLIAVQNNWTSYSTQTTDEVNLRLGPATSYSIISKLNKGVSVSVLAITGEWCLVDYGGVIGYVSHSYLAR